MNISQIRHIRLIKWLTATRRRKLLSSILAVLMVLTSVRFLLIPAVEVRADSLLKFDEGYGSTVNDSSGSASGTITGAAWKNDELCFDDKCLYFDGSDWISFGDESTFDFTASTDFTIEFWFRHGPATAAEVIIQKYEGSGGDGGYRIQMESDGDISFGVDDANGGFADDNIVSTAANYDDNRWHHVAAVKDDTTGIYLYIDGNPVASDETIGSTGTLANDDTFYIGDSNGADGGDEFIGFLDEVKIYTSVARTEAEIGADILGVTDDKGTAARFGDTQDFLSDGLVGYWKMDDNVSGDSQTIADSSGNGYDGTTDDTGTNGFDCQVGGYFNFGCDFDGDDFIGMGDQDELIGDNYSFSFWAKPTSGSTTNSTILFKQTTSGDIEGIMIRQYQTDLEIFIDQPTANIDTSGYFAAATWVHTVVTLDNGTVKVYQNGSFLTSASYTGVTDNDHAFQIGRQGSLARFFDGILDEIRVYNRTLSEAEASALYEWSAPPIAHWNMDQGSGTGSDAVKDISTEGHHFTTNGSMTNDDWVPGRYGSALDFDGTDDDLSDAYDSDFDFGTQSFTVTGWFKRSAVGGTTGSVDRQVSASADDATERANGGGFSYTTSVVDADSHSDSNRRDNAGFRFTNITIPNSATITSAYMSVTPAGGGDDDTNLDIHLEDVDDAVDFNTNQDVTSRVRTTAFTHWDATNLGTSEVDTPDFTSAVQEVVDRMGWASGQDMVVIMAGQTDQNLTTAFDAYDGSPTNAADLHIEYEGSGSAEYILSRYNGAGYKVNMDDDGDICFSIDDDSTWDPDDTVCTTGGTQDDNTWHHFAGVKDATNGIYLYIDGALVASDESLAATGSLSGTSPVLYAAVDSDGSSASFSGELDDFKIYHYARTSGQVTQDMNAGHPAPGSPAGSPILHYQFDDYDDTAYDKSAQGNDGDLAGSATTCPQTGTSDCPAWTSTAKYNRALDFDGTDDFVEVGDIAAYDFGASQDFTLTGWFYRDTATTDDVILAKRNGIANTDQGYILYIDDSTDKLTFEACDAVSSCDEYQLESSTTFTTTGWNHYAIVWDDSTAARTTMYINGYDDSPTKTGTLSNVGDLSNSVSLMIGSESDDANFFDGKLDEIKMFDSKLDEGQIRADMLKGSAAALGAIDTTDEGFSIPDPVGYWPLNDSGGSTALDYSGNGYEGTVDSQASFRAISQAPRWAHGLGGSGLFKNTTLSGMVDMGNQSGLDFGDSQDFSLSIWFYPTELTTSYYTLMAKKLTRLAAEPGYYFAIDSVTDTLNFRVSDATDQYEVPGTIAITTNEWHHAVVVFDESDANGILVYLDGVENKGTATGTLANVGSLSTSEEFRLGSSGNGADDFIGTLDHAYVFDQLLTHEQVQYLFNRGGPIGWWKIDECTGSTANDESIKDNDGTITPGSGGTHTTTGTCDSGTSTHMWDDGGTGKRNYSLDFDGDASASNADYVDMNDVDEYDFNDQDFSIAGWFNRESFTTDDTIVAKRNGTADSDQGYIVYIDDANDTLIFEVCDSTGTCDEYQLESSSTFTSTGWNHFVIVWDDDSAANTEIYINGLDDNATDTGTIGNIGDLSNALDFRIGSESDAGAAFHGELDDIRIYNYALTADQVLKVFNHGAAFFGPATGSP